MKGLDLKSGRCVSPIEEPSTKGVGGSRGSVTYLDTKPAHTGVRVSTMMNMKLERYFRDFGCHNKRWHINTMTL